MTLRESGWQVTPYQRQWSADGFHFQEERRPEGSAVTELLKLRRDIASEARRASEKESARDKEESSKNQGRGRPIIFWKERRTMLEKMVAGGREVVDFEGKKQRWYCYSSLFIYLFKIESPKSNTPKMKERQKEPA
ncbi:hypothetical protein PanWU01x14_335960 [Parasponia andersonii]|uniref:Uncharacterized protein n=1 Tax=Parasponia andersonii TaxID=3476 RepID=A0A2P5AG33_PARAD|nr:hypothetical protein PanWU01x14_335960 [Parasponia andersonii]